MKNCPNCNTPLADDAVFCTNCGQKFEEAAPAAETAEAPQASNPVSQPAPVVPAAPVMPEPDPFDHTAEFDPKDISDNKVFAMLGYLLGTIGIIIALLASNQSPYTRFHVRQALKFTVVKLLTVICGAILGITIIVPIAAAIFCGVLWVIEIICFFQVCCGKAKEPAIIRSLGFLK